jgi:chromosomal replication initiator protein
MLSTAVDNISGRVFPSRLAPLSADTSGSKSTAGALVPPTTGKGAMDLHWARFLTNAEEKIHPREFERWFRPLRPLDFSPSRVTIAVPNEFFLDYFTEKYLPFLRTEIAEVLGATPEVSLVLASEPLFPASPAPSPAPASREEACPEPAEFHRSLNPKYTFETFVVGPSNQFVHAACLAIAEVPGSNYNPLFIYGGVGLGKTHLLNAVGHRILQKQPHFRVIYLHSEQFVNEVITSIRHDRMADFQNKYRFNCDVLLIDDIQFIAGKDRTQVEFFHVFNALHESHRQIVMTSDKFPQEMQGLEERLRSRFRWGLIADIQPPEMETRVAILQQKAEMDGLALPDDVALFLATNIQANVRELEGSLTRVSAYASLHNRPITIELAREVLTDLIKARTEAPSIEHIQKVVANYFNLKVSDLKGERRSRIVSGPRQLAMYLCRKHTKASFPDIGDRFGGKDHSTVITACNKVERLSKTDPKVKTDIENIEKSL